MATFMSLPAEIRCRIYKYHFSGHRVSYQHREENAADEIINWENRSCVALFLACKQVFLESRPVFWQETVINLGHLISTAYSTFCCPVTDPKLIVHAFISTNEIILDDLSRIIGALTNLRSLSLRDGESAYDFNVAAPKGKVATKEGEDFTMEFPGRMIGQEELDGDETFLAPMFRSIIKAWNLTGRSFVLLADVHITRENHWGVVAVSGFNILELHC